MSIMSIYNTNLNKIEYIITNSDNENGTIDILKFITGCLKLSTIFM